MPLIALLAPPEEGVLSENFTVAGRSVLERQIHQARAAGVTRILVLGVAPSPGIVALGGPGELASAMQDADTVLVLAPGLVIDGRILAAVLAAGVPAVATWPATGQSGRAGLERIDATSIAAGVYYYSGELVRRTGSRLGDWDLYSTLLRTALAEPRATRLDLAQLDPSMPGRTRPVPLTWALVATPADAANVTDVLIAASQPDRAGWPARYIFRAVEDAALRWLAPTPVTPLVASAAAATLGIVAGVAFATGWLWSGLGLALLVGPAEGIAVRLSALRQQPARWQRLGDLIGLGWCACLAVHFCQLRSAEGPLAVAALIMSFGIASRLQARLFRRLTGRRLDDAGNFERRLALVAARRDTMLWAMLPFAIAGQWYAGLIALGVYSAGTFFMERTRFEHSIVGLGRFKAPSELS